MAGGPGYASKPRPVVIIQDECFTETLSISVCPLTSEPIEAPILRIQVEPTPENGLRATSRLMVDKVTTVPRAAWASASAAWPMTICCGSTARCWCFWAWPAE
jgi:mRNA interferase MazF